MTTSRSMSRGRTSPGTLRSSPRPDSFPSSSPTSSGPSKTCHPHHQGQEGPDGLCSDWLRQDGRFPLPMFCHRIGRTVRVGSFVLQLWLLMVLVDFFLSSLCRVSHVEMLSWTHKISTTALRVFARSTLVPFRLASCSFEVTRYNISKIFPIYNFVASTCINFHGSDASC